MRQKRHTGCVPTGISMFMIEIVTQKNRPVNRNPPGLQLMRQYFEKNVLFPRLGRQSLYNRALSFDQDQSEGSDRYPAIPFRNPLFCGGVCQG
ncbi:MAG: hypothetical protein OEN52_08775 [Gammaproteobacteria bacterium]|nr:hypothetical protein [Gammaproteobacteria bacterium]